MPPLIAVISALFVLQGCSQVHSLLEFVDADMGDEKSAHSIEPIGEVTFAGMEPAKGLVLRHSSYGGRGRLWDRWEVYEDGRVRRGNWQGMFSAEHDVSRDSLWKNMGTLDAEGLSALQAFLVEIELAAIAGYHNVESPDHPKRLHSGGGTVIYAPVLGPGVIVSVPPGHECPHFDRFTDGVYELVWPDALNPAAGDGRH